MRGVALLATLAGVLALAAPAFAATIDTTGLLSRSTSGGMPNGASRNPAFSQDRQIGGLVVFESDASDLVADDGNGNVTDIFVVRRANAGSDGLRGLPWATSAPQLVTHAAGGGAANGPSYAPDVDGDQNHDGLSGRPRPHCVAYVSSRLQPGLGRHQQPAGRVRDQPLDRRHRARLGRHARPPGPGRDLRREDRRRVHPRRLHVRRVQPRADETHVDPRALAAGVEAGRDQRGGPGRQAGLHPRAPRPDGRQAVAEGRGAGGHDVPRLG